MVIIYNYKEMKKFNACLLLIALILILAKSVILASSSSVTYRIDKEWVRIWINSDGSINLLYNISITYTSGSPEGIVLLGMPKRDFEIQYVRDFESNKTLQYRDVSSSSFYGIEIQLDKPVILGKPYTIIAYAFVPEMVHRDELNPGNVGLEFYPSTFDGVESPINDIRVAVSLPEGVNENEIKYLADRKFDSVYRDNGLLVVYWEKSNWPATEEFWVGVSFPEKYVSFGQNVWIYILVGFSIALFIFTIIILIYFSVFKKVKYEKPRIAIEALGPARGLTAVEAAVVLDLKPLKVLSMILFGLLLKKIVTILSTDPMIKLNVVEDSSAEPKNLRYYEIDFLRAVKSDGILDENLLARTYLNLRDAVNLKIRGFSRIDTVNYYKTIVDEAWRQVTEAGTPELKCDALERNMEWLLVDERFEDRLKVAFPPDLIIYPRPDWWWYWHWPRPPTQKGGGEIKPTPIPGQDFANNIVLALQKAANNIVLNVQEISNRITPAQMASARQRPLRYPNCVCACANCACACACVSCACACAHGGAR
ncbi:MAG: DUF2207 domain-containing protein [Candidatus Bathyarchaeia archaeon]